MHVLCWLRRSLFVEAQGVRHPEINITTEILERLSILEVISRISGLGAWLVLRGLRQHRRVAGRLEEREVRDVVRTLLCEVDAALDALRGLGRQLVVVAGTIAKLEVSQVLLNIRILVVLRVVAQVEVLHSDFVVSHESVDV